MTMKADALYWDFIRSEAALIGTDGCSTVTGLRVECCHEHDLSYYYAKDPRSAYRLWREGLSDYWGFAAVMTRREADARFRQCQQQRSALGRYSPLSWVRWLGVRIGGTGAWNDHRAARQPEGV